MLKRDGELMGFDMLLLDRKWPPGIPRSSTLEKLFMGGLASSVIDTDFKKYLALFGIMIDLVVMYDHKI
ncbi:unnamed protein product [Brassica rapa subsp. trilocularis]